VASIRGVHGKWDQLSPIVHTRELAVAVCSPFVYVPLVQLTCRGPPTLNHLHQPTGGRGVAVSSAVCRSVFCLSASLGCFAFRVALYEQRPRPPVASHCIVATQSAQRSSDHTESEACSMHLLRSARMQLEHACNLTSASSLSMQSLVIMRACLALTGVVTTSLSHQFSSTCAGVALLK